MGDTLLWEEGSVQMESVEEVKRKSKGKESRFGKRYGFEIVGMHFTQLATRCSMWSGKSQDTPFPA
jgi:peroxiredoxin